MEIKELNTNTVKVGDIVEYCANNGAFGVIKSIGEKFVTIQKAVGNVNMLSQVSKTYRQRIGSHFEVSVLAGTKTIHFIGGQGDRV